MGTIKTRRNREGKTTYHAEVRRIGCPARYQSFYRLTDARAWIQDTESALRRGEQCGLPPERQQTLEEAIARYVCEERNKQGRQWVDKLRHLEWFRGRAGKRPLTEVSPSLLAALRTNFLSATTRFKSERKPQTWNRYLSSLSCVLEACVRDWEWLETNPARRVRREKEAPGRIRFLSDDERSRLFEACKDSDSSLLYPLVLLALATGMRRAELLTLRWNQVQLDTGAIILTITKNKTSRRVPVRGIALEMLKDHARIRRIDTDLVFPGSGQGKETRPFNPDCYWYPALRKSQLGDFRFHDLRHSAASYLAMSGASLLEIAEVLGHKTLQMVKRYSHLSASHTAMVVERMNKRFLG